MAKAALRNVVQQVATRSGASAEVSGDELIVRDPAGAIVVVYNAELGTAEIRATSNLVLSAPDGKVSIRAKELALDAPEATFAFGRLSSSASRVFEHFGEVYRDIDGVLQTRTGRARTIVQGVYQLLAGRFAVRSEEDASIDGKRILLG